MVTESQGDHANMSVIHNVDRISSLHVSGLFGRFNHKVLFRDGDNITIITAPNGYGKTVILRIIESVFDRRFGQFWNLEFRKIDILFESKRQISLERVATNKDNDDGEKTYAVISISTRGFGADGEAFLINPKIIASSLRHIERNFSVERIGDDQWIDFQSDRVLSTDQIIKMYGGHLPDMLPEGFRIPDWLRQATDVVNAHLVETQRLLSLDDENDRRFMPRRARIAPPPVVEKDARDLSERIGRALQQYANESQKLDQSFPKRIIEFRDGPVDEEPEIRARLQDLTSKREDLISAGLLGSTLVEPVQPSDVFKQENVRRILSIYIDDTETKLDILEDFYKKLRLFKEIINGHLAFKRVVTDPNVGMQVVDIDTGNPIPLSSLSSGKQHELVLIYELLFKVEDGSMILIDEPELSLHVAWQTRFISDLQKILEAIIYVCDPLRFDERRAKSGACPSHSIHRKAALSPWTTRKGSVRQRW